MSAMEDVNGRSTTLYHLSENPTIERFEPRVPDAGGDPIVWAIDAEHMRNYLLPRDCPRVTFYATDKTSTADREQFLGESRAVVAVESAWLARITQCQLYRYGLPPESFSCIDAGAGYYVSRAAVVPTTVEHIADPLDELLRHGVEVRVLSSLWALHDAVAASSLQFSMIRMRNTTATRSVA